MLSRPIQIVLGLTLAVTAYFYWQETNSAEPELESKARPAQKAIQKVASEVTGKAMNLKESAASEASVAS
ncbi:MAG: hypothetical protein ACRC6G_13575, partial [Deefgea sp.]